MKKLLTIIISLSFLLYSCNKEDDEVVKEKLPVFQFDPTKLKEIEEDPPFADFNEKEYYYESFFVDENGDSITNPGHKIVYKYSKSKEYELAGLKSKYSVQSYFVHPDGSLGDSSSPSIFFKYENDYMIFGVETVYDYLGELYEENILDIHFSSYIPTSNEKKRIDLKYTQIYCNGFVSKKVNKANHNLFEVIKVHNFRIEPYWFLKEFFNENGLYYQTEQYLISYDEYDQRLYNKGIGYERILEK